jgi:CO/xanthine dehydrogenase Mo-binding subunit
VIDIAGALADTGALIAWEHINFNSGASAIASPYRIANVRTEFRGSQSPLREGSYRALAATANTFARESFMDELAVAAEVDPLAFRLRHLADERMRGVLTAAAERFDWSAKWKRSAKSVGVGLACGTEKGSYVACCAAVEVDHDRGTYRVLNVCEAFECGAVQNPENLRGQMTGCIVQGLGAVLYEHIDFKNGRISNPRFSQYQVPRFKDVPHIETVLVNRTDLPSVGGGETPIIAIAPAVANALFNATGIRIRELPVRNEKLKPA